MSTSSRSEPGQGDADLWRMTFEQSPVGMCLVSLEGVLTRPNPAFVDLLGYPTEHLRSLTFQEITHPDDLDADMELYRQTLRGERSSYRLVKRFRHATGALVWADLSVTLIRDEDGSPSHFISQVVDVTSQHEDRDRLDRAMRLVERERSLSQAVLDTVDVGLVLLDREGNHERVNRRQRVIYAMADAGEPGPAGIEAGSFYGSDGVSELDVAELPERRAVAGEEFDDYRIWVGPSPSSRRALSVSARTVRDHEGRTIGAALAYSDVTDLVQAIRAREVFEGSVSHELRTPLTSMLGHLELLLEAEDLPAEAVHQLRVVHRNTTRLQRLVADLLDPAAREGGLLPLAPAPTDVRALVQESIDVARPHAEAAGVHLRSGHLAPVGAVVDAHRLRQVVENLVSNALKYTDPEGSVRVDLDVDPAVDELCITVTDTGIGMSREDLQRLFDPFFRSEAARERVAPGVGLGLGIARSIVAAHGGRIEVASELGRGSSFTARLPREAPVV